MSALDPMDVLDAGARMALRVAGMRGRRVVTDVGELHVLDSGGEGVPVLLLHGLGSASSDLAPLLVGLRARGRRVIAPDLPGHGASRAPADGMDPDALREGLLAAVDALLPTPAVVFGNSLGGLVALRLAITRPDLVRGLMLASPAGAPFEDLEAFFQDFTFPDHAAALRFADRFMARRPPYRHLYAWGLRRRMRRAAIRDLLGRITPDDLVRPDEVRALRMPIRLHWGRRDRVLPQEQLEWFRTHLPPHADIIDDPEHGHAPYVDDPRGFLQSVDDFIARCA